ncbi:MFS domain-containing histidine kinase [Streptomyces sp. RB6PN25]|uniref:histidine kinase n=1 Tax=Streptomyces humicola TaxID=2953240 RepID=A0ABT1PYW2_9ACTN|nr:MFS domain-containing histidine kinase [Streptomyces humicola]MCQ4081710.1 MFS domain-containing histidine kinase [Streptomyces humicola]
MTGGRAPIPRRCWSLRTRLLVSSISLIAVVCATVGVVTALALHAKLYEQLDKQLGGVALRARHPRPPGQFPPAGGTDPLDFVTGPGQQLGTLGAVVQNGQVAKGEYSRPSSNQRAVTDVLDAAQAAALARVSEDGRPHSVDLPGLGTYHVAYIHNDDGVGLLVGQSASGVEGTMDRLILAEVLVTAGGLIVAAVAGIALTNSALRPLRRVAATAGRVSELRLHRGEVMLDERVAEVDTDSRTEAGQVGAALNRLLDHVASALEARHASEMNVRRFVADASHELRTPLASIRGYAELTRRGSEEIGPDTRHALGRIESEAGRMSTLVEDLLLLARLDAGRPLTLAPLDISPLVVDAVSDARAAGPGHHWRLELPDEPVVILGDQERLHQVLLNLLGNARNHTPQGTTVTARVTDRRDDVLVEIEDDGPGIPGELLPYIFERFARGDASRSRHAGSTGLGLAIVHAVTVAHGGRVGVESMPGRTVFQVRLPGPVGNGEVAAT